MLPRQPYFYSPRCPARVAFKSQPDPVITGLKNAWQLLLPPDWSLDFSGRDCSSHPCAADTSSCCQAAYAPGALALVLPVPPVFLCWF